MSLKNQIMDLADEYAECLAAYRMAYRDTLVVVTKDMERARLALEEHAAVSDELLSTLKEIVDTDPVDAALDPQRAVRIAKVVIAKAESK